MTVAGDAVIPLSRCSVLLDVASPNVRQRCSRVVCPPEGSLSISTLVMLLNADAGGSADSVDQSEPS